MGGYGSGLWKRSKPKMTTESKHRIDIRFLRQKGKLSGGSYGVLTWSRQGVQTGSIAYFTAADHILLSYRRQGQGKEPELVEQVVLFDHTPCNYGGRRTWFLCPQCGSRVAILYGAGRLFLCRHCYRLTYSCQQEGELDRALSKALNLREKLGVNASLSVRITASDRPRYMHRKTFDRLRNEADRAANQWRRLLANKFGVSNFL
ncbi:hypothetical protein SAMN02745216_04780 [Desulfatibacillum alkenivorans DSM 16219]|jgi:hypothetical protein|uniref:Uncharacterized protein n=1 Tax=Desulfatibacillum alkenivorans DSM 16219 TaxID=1121393 RepID=A0A1M6YLK7_9BACT|nr:hypothetical protein SAMN02745216_04780 [Desulfatibacillum alkenivorans DSM 16219]